MRWEALFADMEAQLEAAHAAEVAAQVADLTRAERATVGLVGRLRAARDAVVTVRAADGDPVRGTVLDVTDQWVLLADGPRRALVPLTSIRAVAGLPGLVQPTPQGQVERRLGLGHALRALARDRTVVRVTAADGVELVGRLERVGADHVDLTTTTSDVGRPGRGGGAATVWTVPIPAIQVVRSG